MKTCLGTMTKIARKAVSVVLVVLIALGTVALSSCGESSSLSITEEKEYYDNGAVKKETYSYPNGQASKICEYNEAGVMTSMVEYFEDGSIYKDYVINEAGAIIQITEYNRYLAGQAMRVLHSNTFYDENGRIVKFESFDKSDNYTAEYSEDGVCTKTFKNKNEKETIVETYEGNILRRIETTNTLLNVETFWHFTVQSFNEKGNIIEKIEKYSTTDNISREEYIYDEHNNIVKHIYFFTSDGTEEKLACIDYVNEYGTDGQLLKISVSGTFNPEYSISTELGDNDKSYTDYFENGILSKRECIYTKGYPDTIVYIYHKNGNIQLSICYHNGKETERIEYYENGTWKIPKKYW